jgi:hypothetical protein
MARYGSFLPRKQWCLINMYFFEYLSHTVQISSKQCGQDAPLLLLLPDVRKRRPWVAIKGDES